MTGVVFGYKGVLLLFGLLLVYETRSIKLYQINDSRFVSMSMCNIVVSFHFSALLSLQGRRHHFESGGSGGYKLMMQEERAESLLPVVPPVLTFWRGYCNTK